MKTNKNEETQPVESAPQTKNSAGAIVGILIFIGLAIIATSVLIAGLIPLIVLGIIVIAVSLSSIKRVNPRYRGLVERLGRYHSYKEPGLVFLIPFVDKLRYIDITEQITNAKPQEVITKDNLNAKIDAQIYYKVKSTEVDVKNSQYNVNNYELQIVQLAETTLRDVIGNLNLTQANSQRGTINKSLFESLNKETTDWGISIVRAELRDIIPPEEVQEQMNQVVVAANMKIAAVDKATAAETNADGIRRAKIKEAEGNKQAEILNAEGKAIAITKVAEATAKKIKIVNESAERYFKGNAVNLKKLEVTQSSLENNTKIIVPEGSELVNVLGEMSGILPLNGRKGKKDPSFTQGGGEELTTDTPTMDDIGEESKGRTQIPKK